MSWKAAKRAKIAKEGPVCAVCGGRFSPKQLVLHHIKNRKDGGRSTYDNAELRDVWCEERLHQLYHDGNLPSGEKGK